MKTSHGILSQEDGEEQFYQALGDLKFSTTSTGLAKWNEWH